VLLMNVMVPGAPHPLSPPRRVLMTADAMGGVWPYALDLAAGLSRCGSEILVAVMGKAPGPDQRAAAAAIPGVRLVSAPYRLEWMDDAAPDVDAAGVWLLTLARRFRPDLIHLNGYAHAPLPWTAPVVVGAHSCVKTWWRAVHDDDPPPAWDDYTAAVACGLAAADAVIAPTAAFLSMLEDAYGPIEGAAVVHNGRAPTGAQPGTRKEPLILCAARLWDEAKNVACLDAAAAGLPWSVAVAGATGRPDGDAGGRFVHVSALGSLAASEMRSWCNRAAIFVSPALYEPFGLAVLEAAQSGCALVLSDIPTLRELWDGAAVFVRPRDPDALHRALAMLIAEPERRQALGQTAAVRAGRYTPERMLEGTLAAYARASGRWSPAAGSSAGVPAGQREAAL
jgi:glycosyltransferase involved in cell wall biosynthesis